MSSKRLPGKTMIDICGETLLGRVVERVSKSKKVTNIIVASSNSKEDDTIEFFCEKIGIKCFRGDLNNVANRFYQAALNEKATSFIRINGDSPLIDSKIIDLAIDYFNLSHCDIVTNVFPRTYPKGQSVEVILMETFNRVINSKLSNDQKEHVTKKYYDSPENYKMVSFTSGGKYNNINMCVDDTSDELRLVEAIKKIGNKELGWMDLCKFF